MHFDNSNHTVDAGIELGDHDADNHIPNTQERRHEVRRKASLLGMNSGKGPTLIEAPHFSGRRRGSRWVRTGSGLDGEPAAKKQKLPKQNFPDKGELNSATAESCQAKKSGDSRTTVLAQQRSNGSNQENIAPKSIFADPNVLSAKATQSRTVQSPKLPPNFSTLISPPLQRGATATPTRQPVAAVRPQILQPRSNSLQGPKIQPVNPRPDRIVPNHQLQHQTQR